jgi:hypothetical protein
MSLDASHLLDKLTRIDNHKVTGRRFMRVEMFMRGYSKITAYMMGEHGLLMIKAVMICINASRRKIHSRKRDSNYQASRNYRNPEPPYNLISQMIGGN